MESIQLKTYIGQNGILQVKMPANIQNKEVEVMVIFQPIKEDNISQKLTKETQLNWQEFIEKTAGSCSDDPIILDDMGIDDNLDDSLEEILNK